MLELLSQASLFYHLLIGNYLLLNIFHVFMFFGAEFFAFFSSQNSARIHTQKWTFEKPTVLAPNGLLIVDFTIAIFIDTGVLGKVSSLEVLFMAPFEKDFAAHATHHTIVTTVGFLGLWRSQTYPAVQWTLSHLELSSVTRLLVDEEKHHREGEPTRLPSSSSNQYITWNW